MSLQGVEILAQAWAAMRKNIEQGVMKGKWRGKKRTPYTVANLDIFVVQLLP
jgi:hypothetical protein